MSRQNLACQFFLGIGIVLFIPSFVSAQKLQVSELFKQWEGVWQRQDKSTHQYEIWESPGKRQITGRAVKIVSLDTTLLENLKIIQKGKKIYYLAEVIDQNKGKAIPFLLSDQKDGFFRFENPKHDYPQIIEYRFSGNSALIVRIGALDADSVVRVVEMRFSKSQQE